MGGRINWRLIWDDWQEEEKEEEKETKSSSQSCRGLRPAAKNVLKPWYKLFDTAKVPLKICSIIFKINLAYCKRTQLLISKQIFFFQFAKIDAKKAEDARRREKPVEINEWDDDDNENSSNGMEATPTTNEVSA